MTPAPRILIVTSGELTRDPRARRAVTAAVDRGLDVQGLCMSDEGAPSAEAPVARLQNARLERALQAGGLASRARSSPVVRELRGLYRLWRHLRVNVRLAAAGRKLGRFDVVHANDFDTLPAGAYLARRSGARLVYDAHELYTMQEPDPPRFYRAIARRAEGMLARRSDAVVTVSQEIAAELEHMFVLSSTPSSVLNCPPLEAQPPPAARDDAVVRAIYQGAMGPGRALDDLLEAAGHAGGALITIRVVSADLELLRREVAARGLEDRVEIAEPVPPATLVAALQGFQVGLVINRPVTRNDELVLPNKLFEYLMAGLAVVVPDLPSIGELVTREGVGLTFPPGDPAAMGKALARLASDPALLERCQTRAREVAVASYNAETQVDELARAWGFR